MSAPPRERGVGVAQPDSGDRKAAGLGQRPIGIKGIARALGVSIVTVDRALHSLLLKSRQHVYPRLAPALSERD
jgi:hypothetical protein